MISLEWYRTFKAVYKYRNYSKAAQALYMSQPAVSNQMGMLEAAVGHKLFFRKSKGVEPTDNARFLNNLIIDALDQLETVEAYYGKRTEKEEQVFTLGISKHAYSGLLSSKITQLGHHHSIQFEESSDVLFHLINEQRLDYAIVDKEFTTFDTISSHLLDTTMCIVANTEVDDTPLQHYIHTNDLTQVEHWLQEQVWFSHNPTNPYIKFFWLHCFNKKRPQIFTNYVIPNEQFMLEELSHTNGVAITLKQNAVSFIEKGRLKLLWSPQNTPTVSYYLIANKKNQSQFEHLKSVLSS